MKTLYWFLNHWDEGVSRTMISNKETRRRITAAVKRNMSRPKTQNIDWFLRKQSGDVSRKMGSKK